MPRYNTWSAGARAYGSLRLPTVPFPGNGSLLMDPAAWGGVGTSFADSSGGSAIWTFTGGTGGAAYLTNNGGVMSITNTSMRPNTTIPISGTTDFTILFWFRPATPNSTRTVAGWGGGGGPTVSLEININTSLVRLVGPNGNPSWNGGTNVFVTGASYAALTWYQAAYRRTGGIGTFFWNGSPIATVGDALSFNSAGFVTACNSLPTSTGGFLGQFGTLQFFNFALNNAQVLENRNNSLARFS